MRALPLAALMAAAVLTSPATAGAFPRFGAGCVRADFSVSGRSVRAELCRATRPHPPAVIVLHGCGGFSTFDHRIVTTLPKYGISTLDVDYFALTPPPGRRGFCGGGASIGRAFPTWLETVSAAATKLSAVTRVAKQSLGIVGWSLGGGVAVAAAEQLQRFGALAGFSTGSFGAQTEAARLPPTILLSGGTTDAIPLAETLPLYEALRTAHVPTSLYVYPHGSHFWPGAQGIAGIAHAAAFLKSHL